MTYTFNVFGICGLVALNIATDITGPIEYTLGKDPTAATIPYLFEPEYNDPASCTAATLTESASTNFPANFVVNTSSKWV